MSLTIGLEGCNKRIGSLKKHKNMKNLFFIDWHVTAWRIIPVSKWLITMVSKSSVGLFAFQLA